MKKNIKTVFPFGLLGASLVFFFNPNIHIVDLLPDVFGYILLIAGLYYLADLNEDIGEARSRLFKMLYVEVAKGLVFLALFGGLVSPQEKASFILLAALVFGVIELLILIPAVRLLFSGMMQLATKFGSEAIFAVRPQKLPVEPRMGFKSEAQQKAFERRVAKIHQKNGCLRCALEKLQTVTLIFLCAKPAFAMLPEFSSLSSFEYNEGLVDFYDFILLFRSFSWVIMLVLSMIWLYRMIRFLRALRRDTAFCQACLTCYREEVLPKTELFIQRGVRLALSVIGIGMIFSLDFYFEYYNILPDILCACFVIAGLCLLRKYVTNMMPAVIATAGYATISAVASGLTIHFNTVYYFSAIYKNPDAAMAFYSACAATILENILFLVMLVLLARVMRQMITRYSGFSMTSPGPSASSHVCHVHAELKKTLYLFLGGGVACAVTGVLYELLKPEVPFIWMIDFVVSIAFIYLFYRSIWEMKEQIEYKYMLS